MKGLHPLTIMTSLLSELEFNVPTEWHNAFPFQTMLGMITTKMNKFTTNTTTSTSFSLARFCVLHNTLHLGTGQVLAVDLPTVGGMCQALYAPLDLYPSFLLCTELGLLLFSFLSLLLIKNIYLLQNKLKVLL